MAIPPSNQHPLFGAGMEGRKAMRRRRAVTDAPPGRFGEAGRHRPKERWQPCGNPGDRAEPRRRELPWSPRRRFPRKLCPIGSPSPSRSTPALLVRKSW